MRHGKRQPGCAPGARFPDHALKPARGSRSPLYYCSMSGTDLGERSLSICIPTHHGRAGTLAEALQSVAGQVDAAPAWTIEVCISDNASRDGTAAVVRAFERDSGLRVTYHRNERDLGVGPNIFGVLGLARGSWCWPMGSDDHLTEDAVAVMTRLLEAHPEATAVAHPRANFTPDMSDRIEQDPPELYPLVDETTVYRGADAVHANLGLSWAYLGCHVLRRDRLAELAEQEREAALAHRDWPQVYLLGRLARRHPVWVWYPLPLVKSRSDNSYFVAEDDGRKDLARFHADIVEGLGDVWSALAKPGSPVHGELTFRTYRVMATPRAIRAIKARDGHGLRADWMLVRAFAPRFARLRDFWLRSAPALAVPGALQRAAAVLRARMAGPSRPLSLDGAKTTVTAAVPPSMPARRMFTVRSETRNEGDARLASTPPNPVFVSYRWYAESGELGTYGLRTPLPRALKPGARAELELKVLTPWDPGRYQLRISPVQEFVAWFDDLDSANGARFDVTVHAGTKS